MPSPHPSAVAIIHSSAERELTSPQPLAWTAHGETAMYKLSKRLWSIEVHRRLELQTRRVIEASPGRGA